MEYKYATNIMENMFEIGRILQSAFMNEKIKINDSKEAFSFAIDCATKFEEKFKCDDDYYMDIEEFTLSEWRKCHDEE